MRAKIMLMFHPIDCLIKYSVCTYNISIILIQFVMNHVVGLMRAEDKVFDALYKRLYHTGSYYDGLRVRDAKE